MEKRRVLELLDLGVSYTEDKLPKEIWNEKFELLKGLLEAKGEYLGLTAEEIKKVQKQFKENGFIPKSLKLKKDGKNVLIGNWLIIQRSKILNRYRGKTPEEIEDDEVIDEEEKRRVLELLNLGVSYIEDKSTEEMWNEKFELLKGLLEAEGEYFGLTAEKVKKVKKQFKEKGYILQSLKLKKEGKDEQIGMWLCRQREMLNKYRGRTQEEIEKDEGIDEEEKRRVIALLKLGVRATKKVTSQSLGQAGFGSPVEECDKAQADLARRVEELESAKGVTQDEN